MKYLLLLSLCTTAFLGLITISGASNCYSASIWEADFDLAESLAERGMADSARVALERGLGLSLTCYALSDSTVPVHLYEKGLPTVHFFSGFAEAESLLSRAVRIEALISGEGSIHVADLLLKLAEVYTQHGVDKKCRACRERALAIQEVGPGKNDVALALLLSGLAGDYLAARDLDRAEALADSSLRIAEQSAGRESPVYARCLRCLGNCMRFASRYPEAESLYTEASRIAAETLGERSYLVMSCRLNLAFVYRRLDAREEARTLLGQVATLAEETEGSRSPLLGNAYHGVGLVSMEMEEYLESERALESAVSIFSTCLGPGNERTLRSMYALSVAYSLEGKTREGYELGLEVLAGREKLLGPDHPLVAWSLYGVGINAWDLGDYAGAEILMERALRIREETLGPEHHFVGRTLNGLSALYADMGRYDESIALAERSLAIMEKAVGTENSDYARTLGQIASVEEEGGNLDAAEAIRLRQIEIYVSVFGRESIRTGAEFDNLANIYAAQGRYAEAESLYHEAIASFMAVSDTEYPDETWPLTGIGDIYTTQGRYEEADSILGSALDIWEEYLASQHMDVNIVLVLESMCRLKRVLGLDRESLELAKRAFDIRLTTFLDNSRAFAESEALTFSYRVRSSADLYLSCLMELGDRKTADDREAIDVILATKGEVSDAVMERQQVLVREEGPVITAVADTLRIVKVELSGLFVQGPGAGVEAYAQTVDSLSRRARALETRLARLSDTYREHYDRRGIGVDQVERGLPEDATLLEYYRFDYIDPGTKEGAPHYLAAAIGGPAEPVLVDLGPAAAVDRPVERYLAHMQGIAASGQLPSVIDKIEYDRLTAEVYSVAIQPVADGLGNEDLLFIAPDGALNLLSFAGLKDPAGDYLVARHAVHYLFSGRDVLRFGTPADTGRGLFALGNPDFDLDALVDSLAAQEPVLVAMRNVRSSCPDFQDLSVVALPGTQREVERIASEWEELTSEPSDIYMGAQASESNFRLNAPGKRVIHLATHGYYLNTACRVRRESQSPNRDKRFTGENPLLHSGLLFAGANSRRKDAGSHAGSDGVLTAYEVSAMDLSGSDLVVLSACETGLGEVKAGEGVYGLRRAFQMAGARTVVSALWPVSDGATAELMGRLYRETDGGLTGTLRQAQLESIELLRESGRPDHPFTWAAFIAVGDWR